MKKPKQIKTDLSKQYLINLYETSGEVVVDGVICNLSASHEGMIIATAAESPELFQTHRFWDEYFQWLLYTGKIKVYNKDSRNNNEP